MKTYLLSFFFTLIALTATSQVQFEPGYFIDNSGRKVECLIKNVDWKSNPTSFVYKVNETGQENRTDIHSVKEFGIDNKSKYIRSKVKIDRSSLMVTELSYERNPEFAEEQLFLKVLIEGDYNLYQYEDSNLNRFFFNKKESSDIKQLVYKKYKAIVYDNKTKTDNTYIRTNNLYKQQLMNKLVCSSITSRDIESLNYTKNSLHNLFIKYHECLGFDFINFAKTSTRTLFRVAVRPRLRNLNLVLSNTPNNFNVPIDADYGNEIQLAFGIEMELALPFNNNAWTIVLEPVYQSLKSETTTNFPISMGGDVFSKVNYKSLEIHSGLRRYFKLGNDSRLFGNFLVVLDILNKFSVEYESLNNSNDATREFQPRFSFAYGLGYEFSDKYYFEGRYIASKRDALKNVTIKSFSLIFGYRIKNK